MIALGSIAREQVESVEAAAPSGSADGHADGGPSDGHAGGGLSGSKKRKRSESPPPQLPPTSERKAARKLGARSDFDRQHSYASAMVSEHAYKHEGVGVQLEVLNTGLQHQALFRGGQTHATMLKKLGLRHGPPPHKEDQVIWDPECKLVTKPILLKPSNQD